jgi:hypothetical protein
MAEEQNVFIKILADNLLIGDESHPAGSVVEVETAIGKRLVEGKYAEAHGGPAHKPPAQETPHDESKQPPERQHIKTEKAVK